ncbi:SVM family protein ['Fragaria x ananassa' phyllody phytoplasma]|uniref:SVM family protein n=1 Tax='Fragaria x ananassa' phyllody phytoplasma TaxID=2358428 RepID=A0ABS5K3P9_9MOLU|nr:SVM family protein ['Fragaria x ananassa' phyllody phytoplasma]MBS2126544.1 SVM family protein ['Fragaria x ananassa' phyllody phytoplasma]
MFKFKKKFNRIIYICLIIFIGLLLLFNKQLVMAMQNNKNKQIFKKTTQNIPLIFRDKEKIIIKHKTVTDEDIKEIIYNCRKKPFLIKDEKIKRLINHLFLIKKISQEDYDSLIERKIKLEIDLNIIPNENQ